MFLGLDLGTSGVKALLVRGDGGVIGSAEAPLRVAHPHPGWSEQDPANWITAARSCLRSLAAEHRSDIALLQGIGLSGQMHGAVLLDADGVVLRPAILWNDTRASAEAAILDATDHVRALSGNIVFPGFTAPKLAWLATHEPDVFARVDRVLLPKDYLSYWLTGLLATEMSDASGTSWLDVGARAWSNNLLSASGMRRDQMPDLLEGIGIVGALRGSLAQDLGLPESGWVVAGGADNAAAACGVGALGEGEGFVSLGTSGVLMVARDGFFPDPATAVHTFCHAVPDRWYQMGVMLAATDSLNWLSRIVDRSPAQMTTELGDTVQAPGSLRFMPYLSGERTPHNDSALRGGFIGLDIAQTRADLTRAVLEGVSVGLRDSLEALKATGARPDSLLAIGGGSGSRYWLDLLAATLNTPLDLPAKGEFGAALGAARLAICGVTRATHRDVMTRPEIAPTIHPDPALARACDDAWQSFAASYPNLKAIL